MNAALGRLGLALLWLLLATPPGAFAQDETTPDLPAGGATIEGTVRHRATGEPVAGAEVVIYALTPSGAPGLRRLQAGDDGRFVADEISAVGVTYLVGARYDEVSYPGARVQFERGQGRRTVEVLVSERTTDASGLSIESLALRVSPDAGGLRVVESYALHLAGDRAVYVAPAQRASVGAALRAALPDGASDFQMPLGVVPEGIVSDAQSVRFYGPIYPGRQDLSWSYTVPAEDPEDTEQTRYRLSRRVDEAIGRLEVRIPDGGGRAEGASLVLEEGREETGDGAAVQIYSRAGVAPESTLEFAVTTPPSRVDPDAVRVVETRLILHHDDAAANITETHRLEIDGDTAVLGTEADPLLRIPIPDGARRLRFGSDGGGVRLVPAAGGGLSAIGSAGPGAINVELAYRLPIEDPSFELTRRFTRRVPLYTVFLADHGTWLPISDRLHRRRPARTNDLTYAHLEAFEVDADEAITLRLEPIPARGGASEVWVQAGVALLAAALAWALATPLLGREDALDDGDDEEAIPATTRERSFLYEAIRDLEHDFETGKISAEDHERLRDDLRRRAAALLAQERRDVAEAEAPAAASVAAAATPAPAAKPSCPACGAAVRPEHRFCPNCGAPLSDEATRPA